MSNYTHTENNFLCLDNMLINLNEVESFREELHQSEGVKFPVVVITYKSGRYAELKRDLASLGRILETYL